MAYEPAPEVLDNYGNVLVNYALGHGEGIKENETVLVQAPTSALPLYRAVHRAVIEAGGNVIRDLRDDMGGLDRHFYENARPKQLDFPQASFDQGMVDEADHRLIIDAQYDYDEIESIDPDLSNRRMAARTAYTGGFTQKLADGNLSWTVGLYGTEAMAARAGLTPEEYWSVITEACYLDHPNPVERWREVSAEIGAYAARLTEMEIKYLQVIGEDADLKVKIGADRRWVSTTGSNMPSFEIFTTPDYRSTSGWIRFNQPWTRYGSPVEGIEMEFKTGKLVDVSARSHIDTLLKFVDQEPATRRLGEFSLTDSRHSRISRPIGHTLYDENLGGEFGNCHIALGYGYPHTYKGEGSRAVLARAGFNRTKSPFRHEDFVTTTDRVVIATLTNGQEQIIYERGQFQLAA